MWLVRPPLEHRRGPPHVRGEGMAEEDASFDVASAIETFLGDDAKMSLEMPGSLTAEQRKQAKRLADQHKGLKCESYGFGAERRLHLFKQGGLGTVAESSPAAKALPEAWSPVRVKNTFIDDFVPAEMRDNGEGVHMRTLPDRLPAFFKQDESDPAVPWSPPLSAPGERVASPAPAPIQRPQTLISSESSGGGGLSAGGASPAPTLPEGFRFTVRDTFIHIENEEDWLAVPERVSQTMPPGVTFQQCLEAELRERANGVGAAPSAAPSSPPPAAPPPSAPPAGASWPEASYAPGAEVVIEGLLKLPAFNGRTGTVDSLDEDTGRYNVLLDCPAGAGTAKWAKVKGDNLRPRLPAPPQFAPTLSVDSDLPLEYSCFLSTPGGSGGIPPTPKWEDSFGQLAMGGLSTTPLKLDALL